MGRAKTLAFLLAGTFAVLASAVSASTKAGVDAWTRGDFPVAVKEWQAEAAKGDSDAMFNLAQAYKFGKGVPQDLAKAELLFGQAAASGHLQAADMYGLLLFQRGEQVRALPFIKAAADRGDPRAQYLLGIAQFNGKLVPKDWVAAYALVSLAQQQGVGPAATALRQMDEYIPLEQRQQAVAMASALKSRADGNRARQLVADDLGATVAAATAPVAPPVPATLSASAPTIAVRRNAENDSPATAGADYARPAATRPAVTAIAARAVAVHSGPPKGVAETRPLVLRPAIAARPITGTAPTPAPAASGPWRVQLGAFGVAANADAVWAKAKVRPELAGHPRINSRAGAVVKLQAGGFASQAAAQGACTKLGTAGLTCIPVGN